MGTLTGITIPNYTPQNSRTGTKPFVIPKISLWDRSYPSTQYSQPFFNPTNGVELFNKLSFVWHETTKMVLILRIELTTSTICYSYIVICQSSLHPFPFSFIFCFYYLDIFLRLLFYPVACGCGIRWLHLCRGPRPLNKCLGYDSKSSNRETSVLELWRKWSTSSLS